MNNLLQEVLSRINNNRRTAFFLSLFLRTFRAGFLAASLVIIWISIRPNEGTPAFVLGCVAFVIAFGFQAKNRFQKIKNNDFLVSLDMDYPNAKYSPFELANENPDIRIVEEWNQHLIHAVGKSTKFEKKIVYGQISSVVAPFLLFVSACYFEPYALNNVLNKVSNAVARFSDGATLEVVKGNPTEKPFPLFNLNKNETHAIELLEDNMIEVKVYDAPDLNPILDLKKNERRHDGQVQTTLQSFRLAALRTEGNSNQGVYALSFSVKEDVEIYLNSISKTIPIATIDVKELPVPKVTLAAVGSIDQPWSDDKPLPLSIKVHAQNPLKQIRLQITAEGRTSTEIVNNVLANDLTEVSLNYELILETYVSSDISKVEIIAEAIDKAIPNPLIGVSEPLIIETASAYGRYKNTLEKLKELKNKIDEMVKENSSKFDDETKNLASEALEKSANSPFFDGLDRIQMANFATKTADIEQSKDFMQTLDLQENLNKFLFEHETLDDKERDRDFFVAARSLSRLLETEQKERTISTEMMTDRLATFLDERHKRWNKRIEYMQGTPPKSWEKIKKNPFSESMKTIEGQDKKGTEEGQKEALSTLSQTVSEYRSWLDELENAEDSFRKQEEQKMQQGLSSARDQLKEMQKKQAEVSKKLDKSGSKSSEEMNSEWPATRMLQNENIADTASLEGQLRSLSPKASERIKAAEQAMKMAVASGGQKSFSEAESAADMAGRLLRQADSAAQQSQSQGKRKERRRRVAGDNYYGKQIVGGDVEIKREYSVDKKYREEVLDEISSTKQKINNNEDEGVLEDYLRRVIR